MTVTTTTTSITYEANGAQRTFTFPFKVQDDADLVVKIDGLVQTAYSVSGVGDAGGGSITFTTPPDEDALVSIERDVLPLIQSTDLVQFGKNKITAIEDALDRQTMAIQQWDKVVTGSSEQPTNPDNTVVTSGFASLAEAVAYASGAGSFDVLVDESITGEDADVDLPSYMTLRGLPGVSVSGAGNLRVSGSRSATVSNLSAEATKGANTVVVDDGTVFAIGDYVAIEEASDLYDNPAKMVPGELTKILSIATNTLTLEDPLSRTYELGTNDPTVTVIDSVKRGVVIRDLTIGMNIDFGGADDWQCRRVKMTGNKQFGLGGTTPIPSRDVLILADNECDVGAGPNALFYLYNIRRFRAHIRGRGGAKDGVRLRGCAEGLYTFVGHEILQRVAWEYGNRNVRGAYVIAAGNQVNAINAEILIHDWCDDCWFIEPVVHEPGKTGLMSCYETRGISHNCGVKGGDLSLYSTLPIVTKANSIGTAIKDVTFHQYRTAGLGKTIVNLDFTSVPVTDSSLEISGCRTVNHQGGSAEDINLVRTDSSTAPGAEYASLKVRNNKIHRQGGRFLSLGGTTGGTAIDHVDVSGNESVLDDAGENDIITISVPVNRLTGAGNVVSDPASTEVHITAAVTEMHWRGKNQSLSSGSTVPTTIDMEGYSYKLVDPTATGVLAAMQSRDHIGSLRSVGFADIPQGFINSAVTLAAEQANRYGRFTDDNPYTITLEGTGSTDFPNGAFIPLWSNSSAVITVSVPAGASCLVFGERDGSVINNVGATTFDLQPHFAGILFRRTASEWVLFLLSPRPKRIYQRSVTSTPYAVGSFDRVLLVDTTVAREIDMPTADNGRVIHVTDKTGSASTNNITIDGNGANIDGAANLVISADYGNATLLADGTNWFTI